MMKKILIMIAVLLAVCAIAKSEECWVICQPDSFVNVRSVPKMRGQVEGRLMLGDRVETDGRVKNGFVHCVDLSTEAGEGWVYAGYLIADQPAIETVEAVITSRGRVACRVSVGGKRRKWLRDGQTVTVYAAGDEWAVTSEGFVMTEFLRIDKNGNEI